jgi:hypothetical protein
VSRSPLPAWRRLFAAGGAPASAHAVLARAPVPERLLEPMARMRLAADTSLDALARPLDVSAVLARVLEGMSVAQGNTVDETEAPVRARGGATHATTQVKPTSRRRQREQALGVSADRKHDATRPLPLPHRKRIVNETLAVAHSSGDENSSATRTPSVARTTVPVARRSASIGGLSAINARVIVDAPVDGIDRLLALGDPSAATTDRRRPAARTNGPAMEPSASDATRALASAVDRVAARRAGASAVNQHGEPRWHAQTTNETLMAVAPIARETRVAESVTAVANDASSNGGFRGLARRTLVANGASHHLAVRVEQEVRTPSDLPIDTLDSRVAESLARILEREARRHGVDLAESRS